MAILEQQGRLVAEGKKEQERRKRGTRAGLNDSTLGAAHWPPTFARGSCMCRFIVACAAPCRPAARTQVPSASGLVARHAYPRRPGAL